MIISEKKKHEIELLMKSLEIKDDDLIEKFILGSGKGGQKIQKTHSCVYLKHVPTGMEVKCQKDRSRELNRHIARKLLCEKIKEKISHEKSEKQKLVEKIKRQKRTKSKKQKKKMVEEKRVHSKKKTLRKSPNEDSYTLMKNFNRLFLVCCIFLLQACCYAKSNNISVLVFPGANSRDTYFTMHNIKEAQSISKGNGCKVGILDHSFGIANHPELYADGKNFVVDDEEFLTKREWHGYWMALVLREIAPQVEIYALNTHSFKSPESNVEAIEKAIDWAIKNNLNILTYSHSAIKGKERKRINQALSRAHKAGIVTTFIHTGHPENILPWGLWEGKDDGREPDVNVLQYDYTIVKNGDWNISTKDQFLSVSSTSPVVGGVIALMKSLDPSLSPKECKKIIRETSYSINYKGSNPPRVLDAFAAVKRAKENKLMQNRL